MGPAGVSLSFCLVRGPALGAISAYFQACDHDVEVAIPLDLPLKAVEEVALKLRDLAATQTCHVDVIPLRTPLVVVLFPLEVH
jgi:hypothetical protein